MVEEVFDILADLLGFSDVVGAGKGFQAKLGRDEHLADVVVEAAGDAAAFLFLGHGQFRYEGTELSGPVLDLLFQGFVGS